MNGLDCRGSRVMALVCSGIIWIMGTYKSAPDQKSPPDHKGPPDSKTPLDLKSPPARKQLQHEKDGPFLKPIDRAPRPLRPPRPQSGQNILPPKKLCNKATKATLIPPKKITPYQKAMKAALIAKKQAVRGLKVFPRQNPVLATALAARKPVQSPIQAVQKTVTVPKVVKTVQKLQEEIKTPKSDTVLETKKSETEKDSQADENTGVLASDPMEEEPAEDDMLELDDTTLYALENELRTIMTKVWQVLPEEELESVEEAAVVETLRNEGGVDVKNVVALNVTKRLLNVHDSLVVKLHFEHKPKAEALKALLKEYNIKAVRRAPTAPGGNAGVIAFHAQLTSFEDFDRICTGKGKDLRCGNTTVEVTPCYDFSYCPDNLKTLYRVKPPQPNPEDAADTESPDKMQNKDKTSRVSTDSAGTAKSDSDSKDVQTKTATENKKENPEAQNIKVTDETELNEGKLKQEKDEINATKQISKTISPVKAEQQTTPEKKAEAPKLTQVNEATIVTAKKAGEAVAAAEQISPVKVEQGSEASKADKATHPVTPKTSTEQTPKAVEKQVKTAVKTTPVKLPVAVEKVNVNKLATSTEAVQKTNTENTSATKKPAGKPEITSTATKKPAGKPVAKSASEVKPKVDENKSSNANEVVKKTTNVVNKPGLKLTPNEDVKNDEDLVDNDELDDEDILALLAEAVILDECGSEDE